MNWNLERILNLDLKGVNFGVTLFATQFTPVSIELQIENKNLSLGKTV